MEHRIASNYLDTREGYQRGNDAQKNTAEHRKRDQQNEITCIVVHPANEYVVKAKKDGILGKRKFERKHKKTGGITEPEETKESDTNKSINQRTKFESVNDRRFCKEMTMKIDWIEMYFLVDTGSMVTMRNWKVKGKISNEENLSGCQGE